MSLTDRPIEQIAEERVTDARLFANRAQMVRSMSQLGFKRVAEIGVARGDFSELLMDILHPDEFIAFDIFTMHHAEAIWGIPSTQFFDNLDQLAFYQRRFSETKCKVTCEIGNSWENLNKYRDEYFDLVYVDGDHSYAGVSNDAAASLQKTRKGGMIIFNDYGVSPSHGPAYGVTEVVNQIVNKNKLEVVGLALQRHMYCDIALRIPR
jgi:hypothetical protein